MELDRGFVRPDYPSQVLVSYYEAGKICDFIVQKWGNDAILGMIHSYADQQGHRRGDSRQPARIARGVRQRIQRLAELNKQAALSSTSPIGKSVSTEAHANLKAGKNDDAIREGLEIRDLYPDYIEGGSVYELLADAYSAKGDKTGRHDRNWKNTATRAAATSLR